MAHASAEQQTVETVRYEMYPWWRGLIYGITAFMLLVAIVAGANVSQPGAIAFFAAWLVLMVGGILFYTFRVGYALTLSGDTLTWRAVAGPTRSVAVADVVAVRPFGGLTGGGGVIEAIELTDGRPLLVMVRKGLPEFARELVRHRPGISVEFGTYSTMCERLKRQTGFSRHPQP
jgi:hypothetical protein